MCPKPRPDRTPRYRGELMAVQKIGGPGISEQRREGAVAAARSAADFAPGVRGYPLAPDREGPGRRGNAGERGRTGYANRCSPRRKPVPQRHLHLRASGRPNIHPTNHATTLGTLGSCEPQRTLDVVGRWRTRAATWARATPPSLDRLPNVGATAVAVSALPLPSSLSDLADHMTHRVGWRN